MGRKTEFKQIKLNSIIHIGKNEVKVTIEDAQIEKLAEFMIEPVGQEIYDALKKDHWEQWDNCIESIAKSKATKDAYEKIKYNPDPEIISKGTFDITYENEDFDEIIKKLKPLDNMKAMLLNIQRESDNNTLELRKIESMLMCIFDCIKRIENLKDEKGIDIEPLKELIKYGFEAAENRDKELEILIQKVSDRQDDIAEIIGGLDKNILGQLYGYLEELKSKNVTEINEQIESYKNEFKESIENIKENIDKLSEVTKGTGDKIIITTIKETVVTRELMKELHDEHMKLLMKQHEEDQKEREEISKQVQDLRSLLQQVTSKPAGATIDKKSLNGMEASLIKMKNELEAQRKRHDEEIRNLKLSGVHRIQACPICKAVEDRMVVAGQCLCSVCGHEFKELDPTGKNNIDNEEGEQWRKDHAATLELVAPIDAKGQYKLYRMKISGDHTVSNNNCLIIPNKTYDNNEIKNIDFCQPNTNDKLSRERYGSVKTLFLTQGINLKNGWRNEQYPFSDMQNLERIMVWKDKDNGYVEDNELLEKIKKRTDLK